MIMMMMMMMRRRRRRRRRKRRRDRIEMAMLFVVVESRRFGDPLRKHYLNAFINITL